MNAEYESLNKNLEYAIRTILKDYSRFKDLVMEGYEYPEEKNLLKFISSEFSNNSFDKIINEISSENFKNKFHTKGSKRGGEFPPTTPFLAIVYSDSRRNLSVSKYLCIAYIFQADFEGVYLTVSIGSEELNDFDVNGFREEIKNKYSNKFDIELDSNVFKADDFDLHCTKEIDNKRGYDCSYANDFEKGMVFNKFYAKNSSELNNDNLINDLEQYLKLYEFIIEDVNFYDFKSGKNPSVTDKVKDNVDDVSEDCNNFFDCLFKKGFYFDQDLIRNFLLSLKVKPFIILTGNSGTGKTQLAKLFAEYKSKKNYENYKLIPVGANWTETRHIVGFYNVISKRYISTPSLDLILSAKTKSEPHFLILDEMNLSHVERYFSDFLSAIESKKKIPLHNCKNEIKDENGNPIKKDLSIPENLFVIGTVNIDETTYMFSPKVLDRANIIEFETFSTDENKLSIDKYMNNSFKYNELNEEVCSFLENPLSNLDLQMMSISELRNKFDDDKIWGKLSDELTKFHGALEDSNFEFGFRTVNEILAFMYVSKEYEKLMGNDKFDNWTTYFDVQIKQKILPKLHGSEMLMNTLEDLLKNCLKDNGEDVKYSTSAKKIEQMIKVLKKQKYVSFIN